MMELVKQRATKKHPNTVFTTVPVATVNALEVVSERYSSLYLAEEDCADRSFNPNVLQGCLGFDSNVDSNKFVLKTLEQEKCCSAKNGDFIGIFNIILKKDFKGCYPCLPVETLSFQNLSIIAQVF